MNRELKNKPELDLQIDREDEGWPDEASLESLCDIVLGTAADVIAIEEGQPFPPHACEVSLVFTDDASIRELNAEWRGQDKPTNVLSFPAYPLVPGGKPGPMLGDIVIARETVSREAIDLDRTFDDHLRHLLVHGFLHLFGYDHIETADAERMEALETRILGVLGVSDPYAGHDPV